MNSVADTIARMAIAEMGDFLSRKRGPKLSVQSTIDRMREFVRRPKWSRSRLALAAGLSINALSGLDRDDWNPTAETLRAAERVMDDVDRPVARPDSAAATCDEVASMNRPLERAIEIAGSQLALAKALGCQQSHVSYWLRKAQQVPAERVLAIEAATGGAVSRHELRPDIYPPPGDDTAAERSHEAAA